MHLATDLEILISDGKCIDFHYGTKQSTQSDILYRTIKFEHLSSQVIAQLARTQKVLPSMQCSEAVMQPLF